MFGHIDGTAVGEIFEDRKHLRASGIHVAMREAFEEIGPGEVEIDQKPDHRIKPSASLADFDPNSCILSDRFSEIIDLLSQGYFLRESAFREMRSLR